MSKLNIALAAICVAMILFLVVDRVYDKPEIPLPAEAGNEGQTPTGAALKEEVDENPELTSLFQAMGVIQVDPIVIPYDITLEDMNGTEVKFSDFKGNIVFLNFWATWCPPCRDEMPSMEKLHQRLKEKNFVMVAVDLQEPVSRVKEFFEDFKLTFRSLLDSSGEVAAMFNVVSIPTTYMLDKEGRIIGMALGSRDWDTEESFALFEYLIEHEMKTMS